MDFNFTFLPPLDAPATYRRLEQLLLDPTALKRFVLCSFTEGSSAICETTACFLLNYVETEENAVAIAELITPLPTAINPSNSRPLARIAAKLAVSHDFLSCAAPLERFAYAESAVKRHALEAVFTQLNTEVTLKSSPTLTTLLNRIRPFFQHLIVDVDPLCRYEVVRKLTALLRSNTKLVCSDVVHTELAHFLLDLRNMPSPYYGHHLHDDEDQSFEPFLMSSIATLLPYSETYVTFVKTILIRMFDFSSSSVLRAVFTLQPSLILQAINEIGIQIFMFVAVIVAATHASRGHFLFCEDVLDVMSSIMSEFQGDHYSSYDVIVSIVNNLCTSIMSMATATGALRVLSLSSEILNDVQQRSAASHSKHDKFSFIVIRQSETIVNLADEIQCPGAVFGFSVLRKLLLCWRSPPSLTQWMSKFYSDMLHARFTSEMAETSNNKSAHSFANSGPDDVSHAKEYDFVPEETSCISVSVGAITLVALHHENACVRLTAVDLLSRFQDASTMVFLLPAIIVRLQEEKNPTVAVQILHDIIVSETLTQRSTSALAIGAVIRILRAVPNTDAMPLVQACFVSIARAGRRAPGIATAVLQTEAESIRERFLHTKASERVGIAAAIFTLTKSRPARGSKFVPLIAKCITQESTNLAPEAAALCFDALYIMVKEDVLDATKTVKIVLKEVPDFFAVSKDARRSLLRLLGCASIGSSSKKGRALAEKVIPMLRDFITRHAPFKRSYLQQGTLDTVLSWAEVGQGAQSLTHFTVDEILRIEFVHDEPLTELEAERQRLEHIQHRCATITESMLNTITACEDSEARNQLQNLIIKIATHEWDIRPRGAFDPERIAKLTATADALRQARKSRASNSNIGNGHESACGRFAKGVDSMPDGVIKVLCAFCAKLNSWAMRAVVAACAATPALPWASALGDALKLNQTYVQAAALNVLWRAGVNDVEFVKLRSLNININESRELRDPEIAVEIFLGCVQHYEENITNIAENVKTPHTAEAVLRALTVVEGHKRLIAGKGGAIILDRMERAWDSAMLKAELEDIVFNHCFRDNLNEGVVKLRELKQCSTQIRLLCRYNDASVLRMVIGSVVQNYQGEGEQLRAIGVAISKFDKTIRRKFICEMAQEGGAIRATIACHAIGGAVAIDDIGRALCCCLALCEDGERVALVKLRDDLSMKPGLRKEALK